jgi:hypothetical protein
MLGGAGAQVVQAGGKRGGGGRGGGEQQQQQHAQRASRGHCRLDLQRWDDYDDEQHDGDDDDDPPPPLQRLLCSSCQGDAVVRISVLGRIVCLRQTRYYLAPCCGAVQVYAGRGDEFSGGAAGCGSCCSGGAQRGAAGGQGKQRCALCTNLALPEGISRVDHLTGELRTVRLCQRHTPHADMLRLVANWRQLEAEVLRLRARVSQRNCTKTE